MATFTLIEATNDVTILPIYKLSRDGRCYYDESKEELKKDEILWKEFGSLWSTLKYVANLYRPLMNKNKYKKLNVNFAFPLFEVRSENLRMYVFTEQNTFIILRVEKKSDQDPEFKWGGRTIQEYSEFKNQKR
jgi:hypothetical protein